MANRKKGLPKGFFPRGGKIWVYADPLEGGRKSTGCKTVEGAIEWLKERERRAANPAYTASHTETLSKWVKRMLADKQQQRSAGTLDFYTKKVGHLLRVFGDDRPLVEINADAVDQYKDQRFAEKAHHHTISKEFTALRQILKKASRADVYAYDLGKLFPPEFGTGYTPRESVLSLETESILRQELQPHQWGAVAFIIATSARFGEMRRARKGDWDRANGTVLLRGTKTKKSFRLIPVVSVMLPYLEAAEPHMPFDFASLTQQLKRICKRHGLPPITANDLRRTSATRLIEAGADPYAVTRVTGHTNTKMLKEVYDRSRVDAAGEAIEGQLAARAEQRARQKLGTETAQRATEKAENSEESEGELRISNPRVGVSNTSGRAEVSESAGETSGSDHDNSRSIPVVYGSLGTETAQFPAGVWALAEAAYRLGVRDRRAA